jgi:hypothetical protein
MVRPFRIWNDHVKRRQAFQAAHPEVRFTPPPDTYGRWAAEWDDGPSSSVVITRRCLGDLMDELGVHFPADADEDARAR